MGDPKKNLMRQFKKQYYSEDVSVEVFSEHGKPEFMSVDDPAVLAAFVAFCSNKEHKVFLRGCTNNYKRSVPSLFRIESCKECDEPTRDDRWRRYKKLLKELESSIQGDRWKRENLGAILQHYGIGTPWLDVVHDLRTAIWFANHEFKKRGSCCEAVQSKQKYGWISVYSKDQKGNQNGPIVADLWSEQSSRHLRPHVQQGMSLAMQPDCAKNPSPKQDFEKHQVAQVRFANSNKWLLRGHMFSTSFLFPAPELDDSLKQLSTPCVQKLLDRCGFGTVTHYCRSDRR